MTDRELLELAAKSAGFHGWQSKHGYWNITTPDGESVVCCANWPKFDENTGESLKPMFVDAVAELNWNPLTDDGDALRMAVKLSLLILQYPGDSAVRVVNPMVDEGYPDAIVSWGYPPDPYAATRRAIVRAAAYIGETI